MCGDSYARYINKGHFYYEQQFSLPLLLEITLYCMFPVLTSQAKRRSWGDQNFSFVVYCSLTASLCKGCPYLELFSPHYTAFGLNMETFSVSLRIQSKRRKMQTRITPNTDTFYAVHLISVLV